MPWPVPNRPRRSSESDYCSASDGSMPPEKIPERDPAQSVQERPEPASANDNGELAFCAAVGRPDTETVPGVFVLNELMTRVSDSDTHVLIRGTIESMVDPLRCPLGFEEGALEACVTFYAGMPVGLKAHLETVHGMHNVNLACPCPAKFNGGVHCDYVQFDPVGYFLPSHIRERHPQYKERMIDALCKQENKKTGEKHREFIRTARTKTFPEWTGDSARLWPSQIMADRIVIPTRVLDGQVKYVCKIDVCATSDEGPGRLLDSSGRLHAHLMMQHGRRCANPTQIYHACADPECREQLFDADHMMETHIRAVHPQLFNAGQPVLYSEAAQKARARLEALVMEESIGEALSSSVDSEETADTFLCNYDCPVQGCEVNYDERDYMLWHIAVDHEDEWNAVARHDNDQAVV